MRLSVAQCTADTDDEDTAVFFCNQVLAFLRSLVRIFVEQFLGMDEMDVVRQERLQLRVGFTDHVFRAAHGRIDTSDNVLQEFHRALFGSDDPFPVPLVHVQRVQVAQFFVGTDGVHVGIDAISRRDMVVGQRDTFPLGQRVNHFGLLVAQILDGERYGPFHPVQVIVDTHSLQHEEWGRDTAKPQLRREILLEKFFYLFDAQFGLFHVEPRAVVLRFDQITHSYSIMYYCFFKIVGKDRYILLPCNILVQKYCQIVSILE